MPGKLKDSLVIGYQHAHTLIRGELTIGIFVNAASVIMGLGVAATILVGTGMILSPQCNCNVPQCLLY